MTHHGAEKITSTCQDGGLFDFDTELQKKKEWMPLSHSLASPCVCWF